MDIEHSKSSNKPIFHEGGVDDLIEIDPRSHLEVADHPLHRYAKNLRYYFQEYARVVGGLKAIVSGKESSSSRHLLPSTSSARDESSLHSNDKFKTIDQQAASQTAAVAIDIENITSGPDPWEHFRPFFRWLDDKDVSQSNCNKPDVSTHRRCP
jgi:hypothetical protein